MRISQKTLIITGLTMTLVLIGVYAIIYTLVGQSVYALDKTNLQNTAYDASVRLDDEASDIYHTLGDWASWDDTYNFMETKSEAYVKSNLEDVSVAAAHIDIIGFYGIEGNTVLLKMVKRGESLPAPTPKELLVLKPDDALLAPHEDANHTSMNHIQGLMILNGKLTAVASKPILTSKGEGPARGTILMGRYISQDMIAALGGANNSYINTSVWLLNAPMEKDVQSAAASLFASGDKSVMKNIDERVNANYEVVNDIYGEPIAILRIERTRTGNVQFMQGMHYMLIAFIVVAIVFEILNFVLLDWFVLSRLKKLENQAEEIGKSDSNPKRIIIVDGGSGDEISHLAADINRMLSRLAKTQEELLQDQMNYGRKLHYEVKQKTHMLERANARLRHVEKMRNQFLFNIGHELKSPLAVIEMNKAAITSRTQDKSQHEESEAIIDRNMLRLKQKIEEIIQLSRFEQSRIVQKKEADFCALVRETAEIYRDFARVKKAHIYLAGASRCAMVMGDKRLLLYALSNLFSNAVRYCDTRGVYAKVAREGGNLVFSIANYGPSIKPKNRHKLFHRFFKEDPNAPGTGVGLFITREIVKGHGGKIWHKPNRPSGAIFIFSIPAKKGGETHETK